MENAIRQRASRPALDERAHHRCLRGGARRGRRAAERARPRTRSSSSATCTEAINLVAHSYRPRRAEARPGGGDLGHGAPLQHRALADAARRATASSCASRRSPTPASSTWRRSRRCWPTARSGWSPITHMSNVLGTYTPAERIVRHRACAWREGAVRRRAGGGASARRCAGAGLRLLRLHRAQAVWPDRHRRAVGPARAARRDAAVPRRRRDDLVGDATSVPPGPRCRTSSRPARRRSWKASG